MTLTSGALLGPYETQALLGAGGMGEVYRAKDTRLGRTVAIKVLSAAKGVSEERRQRFLQEARAVSALNHPNIVTLFDVRNHEGLDFLVLEYVLGKTLDQLIGNKGLRTPQALKIAIPMAAAQPVESGSASRPREDHSALPAQGSSSASAEHRRRETHAGGGARRERVWGPVPSAG